MLESDWFTITWSAKWLFEEEVFTGKLTPEEAKEQDDSQDSMKLLESAR